MVKKSTIDPAKVTNPHLFRCLGLRLHLRVALLQQPNIVRLLTVKHCDDIGLKIGVFYIIIYTLVITIKSELNRKSNSLASTIHEQFCCVSHSILPRNNI